jgi:hypothetical protein
VTEPKKLNLMNADLAKQGVYDKNTEKMVTWLAGLRNDAAHGQYGNYDADRVNLMIDSVRNFVTSYPA